MMNLVATIFCASTLTVSTLPNPAPNYYSWFSPEVVDSVCEYLANNEYHPHVDYNGDGVLTIADAVCIARRYQENVDYGNEITIDSETVEAIIEENYSVPCIYWEFDEVDGEIVRQYEVTTDRIITADIYFEFEDFTSDHVVIEINPFQEIAKVIS
ncbi:MAG: hypothetical protein J6S67_17105 [Methanobrevibacter sp.]|nr:hypothetical protein [Methanobrevibacter sp.]